MKFFCDRCQTKYSIADEKVRRKVLKVRCKTCSNIIEVRESGVSGPVPAMRAAQPAKAASPVVKSSQSPLGRAFDHAFTGYEDEAEAQPTRLAAGAPSASAGRVAPAAAVKPVPAYTQQISFDEDEWYFAVDGVQDGPFGFEALIERVSRTRPQDEPLVWRDGFDEWTLAHQVPEIKVMLRPRPITSPPPSPPPPPAAAITGAVKKTSMPLAELHAQASQAAARPQTASPSASAQVRAQPSFNLAAAPLPPAPSSVPADKEPQLAGFSVEAAARALNLAPAAAPVAHASAGSAASVPFSPASGQDFSAGLFGSGSPPRGSEAPRQNGRLEDLIPRALAPSDDPHDDMIIGEASRIVRLPLPMDIPARKPRQTTSLPRMTGARTSLPGMAGSPAKGAPVLDSGLPEQSGAMPAPEMSYVSQAVAPRKRRTRIIIISTAVAVVALIVILVAALWPASSEDNTRLAGGNDVYSDFNINSNGRIIMQPGQTSIDISKVAVPGTPTPPPTGTRPHGSGTKVTPPVATGPVTPPPQGDGLPPLPKKGGGGGGDDKEPDLFHKPDLNGDPPVDEAVKVAGDLRLGVKQCFERALKQDPSLKNLGKVDLTLKIQATGKVRAASLGNVDETLSECVETISKGRPFPKYGKDYEIQVPFYLRGS